MGYILATSDRLLVQHYLDSAAVGVYSVPYSMADRTLNSLFMGVTLAAFPLTMVKMEREGPEAARRQLYQTGSLLLAVALPACAGFIAANDCIAHVLFGPQFRDPAAKIMPWIVGASLLGGLQKHFFDHAFHVARRSDMFLWSMSPAVVLNIGMNVVLLPRIGVMAAAYSTLAGYAVSLAGSIVVGRRVFRIDFPFRPAARIVAATGLMVLVLKAFRFPPNLWGLIALVSLGTVAYGLAAIVLDAAGIRGLLLRRFSPRRAPGS
jgi:O-antigen/teichoic acid export membrane protein